MLNAQASNEMLDRTKLFFYVSEGMDQAVISRLFQKYEPMSVYRSPLPKNFAIVAFNNEGDAQRAMLDLGNQPPFNLNFTFARSRSQATATNKKTYKSHSGPKSEVTRNRNGLNKSKGSEGHNSDHSSSPRGSSIGQEKRSTNFAGPANCEFEKKRAVVKSSIKKQPQNAVHILVDKTLDVIKTDSNLIESIKVNEWFGRALKDFINLYMDNVKNPSENIKSIHEEFKTLTEEDFSACNESGGEELTIPRASVAESLSVGEEMKLSIVSTQRTDKALVCVTVSDRVQCQYQSLCDEFSGICEKQDSAGTGKEGGGGLMAVKLCSDGMWYRAVTQDRGWALLDDGRVVASDEVQRPMPCPQPFSDIPFFCCLLTHDIKILNEDIPFTVKVSSKDEENRMMEVTLCNDEYGLQFKAKLKPWIPSVTVTSITAERQDPLPQKAVQSKSKQNNQRRPVPAVSKIVAAPLKTVSIVPKVRQFVAEVCSEGEELNLSVLSTEGQGLLCLTMRDSLSSQYESLCDEFAAVCEKQEPASEGKGSEGELMAVRLASDGLWYRAVPHHQGWALPDDGRTVTSGEVQRKVLCPQPYADIPFFCCLLMHDLKNINDSVPYTAKIIRKDAATRSLNVKVSNNDVGASFDGRLQPWPFSTGNQPQPTANASSNQELSPKQKTLPVKSPKFRTFAAENCEEGDELNLSILSAEAKGLVCLTLSDSTTGQYESLCDEFTNVCEKQKPAPAGKVREGALMAVKLASDLSWYRAIFQDKGWVLPDDGRTVAPSEVQRTVACPLPYADIPFFCCLLTHDEKKINIEIPYAVKIVRKEEATRTLNVKVYNKDTGATFDGRLQSWLSTAEKNPSPPTTCSSAVRVSEKPKLSDTASPVVSSKPSEKKTPSAYNLNRMNASGDVINKDASFLEKDLKKSTTENTVTQIRFL